MKEVTTESGTYRIRTNNHKRPILNFWELSEKEQKKALASYDQDAAEEQSFVVYRGEVIALENFQKCRTIPAPFEYAYATSYFSAILLQPVMEYGETFAILAECKW